MREEGRIERWKSIIRGHIFQMQPKLEDRFRRQGWHWLPAVKVFKTKRFDGDAEGRHNDISKASGFRRFQYVPLRQREILRHNFELVWGQWAQIRKTFEWMIASDVYSFSQQQEEQQ